MNLKDLISVRAFPVDADGFAVVPMRGLSNFPNVPRGAVEPPMPENPTARIFPILLPGPYCLVGYDAAGDVSTWNVDGEVNPVLPFGIVMSSAEVEINSLQTPPSIEKVDYVVTYTDEDGDDVPYPKSFDNEYDAIHFADLDDEKIFRKTETVFVVPDGLAGEVKIEQISGEVSSEDEDADLLA